MDISLPILSYRRVWPCKAFFHLLLVYIVSFLGGSISEAVRQHLMMNCHVQVVDLIQCYHHSSSQTSLIKT